MIKMKTLSAGNRTRDKCVKMPPAASCPPKKSANRRGSKRSQPRILMRAWLENLLDTGLCPGLQWVDKPSRVFSIVWRHGSNSGFNPSEHSEVFYRWATHTGKAKKGSGLDHSHNKSTFRCAIHSLPYCIDRTQDGDKKGADAKRTFQFIEPGHPEYDRKKRTKCTKKNEIQPKEETLACTSDTDEPYSWALDLEHSGTDQDISTLDSEHSMWTLEPVQSVEVPDCEQITSTLSHFPEEAGTSAFIDHPSSTLGVEQTAEFGEHSLVSQKTVRTATSPLPRYTVIAVIEARSPVPANDDHLPRWPKVNATVLVEAQPNSIVVSEDQEIDADDESIQPETVDYSKLPVFAKLGLSITDTCEAIICNTRLNSGGNVKINEYQLNRSSPLEFVKQQLLQQHNDTAVVPVSGPDFASTGDTDYGGIGLDSMDCIGGTDVSNTAKNRTHDNMALDEYFPELYHNLLAEETNLGLLADLIFEDNNKSQICLPDN
ncbi:hypothetical protein BsWGS_20232 [Bradybaena similaris]